MQSAETLLGMDPDTGAELGFPGFGGHWMNGHTLVLGDAASGKTYLAMLRAVREQDRDTTVYVIDSEGEYTGLVSALGGRTLTPGRPGEGFNPFLVTVPEGAEPHVLASVLHPRIATLTPLVAALAGLGPDPDRTSLVEGSLAGFYQGQVDGGGAVLGTGGLQSYLAYLDTVPGASALALALREMRPEVAALLLTGGLDPAPPGGLVSWDLSRLRPSLRGLATALAVSAVWEEAVRSPAPRLLIADEFGPVLGYEPAMQAFTSTIARARKQRLALMLLTQDTDMVLDGETLQGRAGLMMLQNCAQKVVLRHSTGRERGRAAEALALDAATADGLRGLSRGHGFVLDHDGNPVSVVTAASPAEAALIEAG